MDIAGLVNKYEYGATPCYSTFECSGFALWYRYPTLCSVSCALLRAFGNRSTVALYRLWPRHSRCSRVSWWRSRCGYTSLYGYSRPLIISTDLWGVPTSNKDGTLQTGGRVGVSSSAAFEWESSFEKRGAWLGFGSVHCYSII